MKLVLKSCLHAAVSKLSHAICNERHDAHYTAQSIVNDIRQVKP